MAKQPGAGGEDQPPQPPFRDRVRKIIASAKVVSAPTRPIVPPRIPEKFQMRHFDGTVYRYREGEEHGKEPTLPGLYYFTAGSVWMYLSGPFHIIAESRERDGEHWGLLLRWKTEDGEDKQWMLPAASEGVEAAARLKAGGLKVSQAPGAKAALLWFLSRVGVDTRLRIVSQTGWYFPDGGSGGPSYVLPDRTLTASGTEHVALEDNHTSKVYRSRGDLEAWRVFVSSICVGNSRALFSVSMAFAGPLLRLVNDEGGGINFRGMSSQGKTTLLSLGASVWGAAIKSDDSFVEQWRTTSSALEQTCASRNDNLLVLDEMGASDGKELSEIIYMIANGAGRQRAKPGGGNRAPVTWRTLVLSSSEHSAATTISRAGGQIRAGQEIRLLDVPAVVHGGHGVFEALHGAADGASFSRQMQEAVANNYGTAGTAFVSWLLQQIAIKPDFGSVVIDARCRLWIRTHLPYGADGQVARAARRFALIAVAGELAVQAGVVDWPHGAAFNASASIFADWLRSRGTAGNKESQVLISAFRRFFSEHGSARFEIDKNEVDEEGKEQLSNSKTILRAGFRWREPIKDTPEQEQWVYGLFPEVFEREISGTIGMEKREALAILGRKGMIRGGVDGEGQRWTHQRRFEGGQRRLIFVESRTLDDDGDETEALR